LARRFAGGRLVVASHNPGKLREFQELLAPYRVEIVPAAALGLPEPEETGATFAENARLKAHAATDASGLPALADDSGITVAGLDGWPGVRSARWAGPGGDFDKAMARVRTELIARFGTWELADRRAAFVAALCLAWPDGGEELVEGRTEGALVDPPRGAGGFGYDPMFVPKGERRTFAEMTPEEKHAQSHRGRALRVLIETCFATA